MNKEIDDFIQDSGYEFILERQVDGGTLELFSNWKTMAIVITTSAGGKRLLLEVTDLTTL